jgi:2-polyprenyl-3-methyl-5-hydroxy-6-metoxy-1,4-benzoquinol methylase
MEQRKRALEELVDCGQGKMKPSCRQCGSPLHVSFCNLGMSPLANSLVEQHRGNAAENHYPLELFVCSSCLLVQLDAFETPDAIFSNYSYFSSYSSTWLQHAKSYVDKVCSEFKFDQGSQVVEIASNDGYLLKEFIRRAIPAVGIEPAVNVAKAAQEAGVPTINEFFGSDLARQLIGQGLGADLIVANNVLAHVPDLRDFVSGLKLLLKPTGIMTIEFPHLLRLIKEVQFDTVYHEHFSYFSFFAAEKLMAMHGLQVFDVDRLDTHGGSLRLYVTHEERSLKPTAAVRLLREEESRSGLLSIGGAYQRFPELVRGIRRNLLRFLLDAEESGKTVVGYGAPAKAVTLLSYCGIGPDLVKFTVDRSPHKQGRLLPGSRLPIYEPDRIKLAKPDYILIFPWNLKDEIMDQLSYVRAWGAKFVVAIPEVAIIP